jgi:hemoglobin
MTDTASAPSLYDRLGGEAAIMAAVDLFYQKVMADELTRPFFAELDMPAQVRKQVSFMSWASGSPERYPGRDLRQAHAKLVRERGLSDVHFDAVARHLKATLEELGIDAALVAEAMAIVASTRNEVLGR